MDAKNSGIGSDVASTCVKQVRLLIALTVVTLMSACATVGTERTAQLKSGTSIATLSLMGDTLPIRVVGTTVFQNKKAEVKVPEWQIDSYTELVAGRLIRADGRFKVVQADTADAHAIMPKLTSIAGGTEFEGGNEIVVAFGRNAGTDLVLVVVPALYGDPYFGTNQSFSGYGVYQRSFLWAKNAVNFLTMRVALFDGKSGEEIARTSGYISSRRPSEAWMEPDNLVMGEENSLATKQAMESLIGELLKKLLSDLKIAVVSNG